MEKKDDQLCNTINAYVEFWDKQESKSQKEKLNGLAFSILRIFDGVDTFFDQPTKIRTHKMLHNMYMEKYLKSFDI